MRKLSAALLAIIIAAAANLASAQTYSKLADDTIKYVKAGTFGKPDVAKKTEKLAIGQVRVHFKTVTSRSSANGRNSADVTTYLDSDLTTGDLEEIANEFYRSLTASLNKIGIATTSFDAVKTAEYYIDRLAKRADDKNADYDGKLGQAWVSVNAFDGPVLFRWRPQGTPEIVGFGQLKKMAKTGETAGGDLMMIDVVLDFASIMLSADIKQDRQGWFYGDPYFHADYSIGGLMNVPESYIFMVNGKNKFDTYRSEMPVAERFGFADKPREDPSKAAYSTAKYFNGERHSFTPLVITAKRDLYKLAAKKVLARYADVLAEKFRVIRNGEKPSDKNVADKPQDTTTLQQVNEQAKKNNEPTPVTTGELTAAAADAEKQGKFQLAADYYGQLIKVDAENFEAYFARSALLLNHLNSPKDAIKDLDRAIKLRPNEPLAYFNRGTAYVKTEDWKKAKKDFDVAISGRPDYVDAYLNRGIALIYLKDLDAALADFERGIQLNPRVPNLYRARAAVYKAKGNAALAAADELRAAQIEKGRY